jgi:hypothetical protein
MDNRIVRSNNVHKFLTEFELEQLKEGDKISKRASDMIIKYQKIKKQNKSNGNR